MANFCGKCGTKLDEATGLCPKCNAEEINRRKAAASPIQAGREKDARDAKPEKVVSNKEPEKKEEKKTENKNATKADKKAEKKAQRQEKRAQKRVEKKAAKKEKRDRKKAEKRAKRKAEWAAKTFGQKVKSILLRLVVLLLLLALLTIGVTGALVYCDILKIDIVNDLYVSMGLKEEDEYDSDSTAESYKVTPPDAESYYANNSQVISEINVKDSDAVQTEEETCDILTDRGFTQYPATTEYSMDGTYSEAVEISDTSSTEHPIYQTYYITEGGEIWTIIIINGAVMANPASYNLQSDSNVQVIFSESDSVTSYDSTTNKFYVTIPTESALIVKTVDRIDAETLEGLTIGEIDAYE